MEIILRLVITQMTILAALFAVIWLGMWTALSTRNLSYFTIHLLLRLLLLPVLFYLGLGLPVAAPLKDWMWLKFSSIVVDAGWSLGWKFFYGFFVFTMFTMIHSLAWAFWARRKIKRDFREAAATLH